MKTKTLFALLMAGGLVACSGDKTETSAEEPQAQPEPQAAAAEEPQVGPNTIEPSALPKFDALPLELYVVDNEVGNGQQAKASDSLQMHYTGWLFDPNAPDYKGKKFDSSLDRGRPFPFQLGVGRVIRGWDVGVEGMRIGGKRTLYIPSHMGYGSRGAGGVIPPNAALIFDVQLLDVNPAK